MDLRPRVRLAPESACIKPWRCPSLPVYAPSHRWVSIVKPEQGRAAGIDLSHAEGLIAADMARTNPSLLSVLGDLVDEQPLHQGLAAFQMLALHRHGRTAAALRAYERLRRDLADALGAAPSRHLAQFAAELRALAHGDGRGGSSSGSPLLNRT